MTISRDQPLTPSALAREASDAMSQRDTYIPTIEVINGMRQELRACNEDPMSTQTNRISERPYSIREAPVNQKHAARFLNMHQLMRHAHVSTTMDQYGNASALAKRKANRPIVQRLLRRPVNQQVSIQ